MISGEVDEAFFGLSRWQVDVGSVAGVGRSSRKWRVPGGCAGAFSMSARPVLHRYLRKATRREHAAAEATAVMREVFEGPLSPPVYVRLLLGYYALYAQWEAQHHDWLEGELKLAGWHYRSRLPAIRADLRALGREAVEQPMDSLPPEGGEPGALRSEAGDPAWGSLYVVEGSALGGQVIARQLAAGFPGHAHRFFTMGHGHGQPAWRDFQILLDGQLGDAASRRTIALQARVAFGRFQQMLESVLD